MIAIDIIRNDPKRVATVAKQKNLKIDVKAILCLDDQRISLAQEVENLEKRRNQIAKVLADADRRSDEMIAEGKRLKAALTEKSESLRDVNEQLTQKMLWTPQIPSDDTPVGDESANKEVRNWGTVPPTPAYFKDHTQLAHDLDLLDVARGNKVSGFRGYFLKNEAAVLTMALMQLAMQTMIKHGYAPVIPPTIVKERFLYGTGYFPFGEGDNYQIGNPSETEDGSMENEKLFLAGTAEVGLGAMHAGEVINVSDAPLKYCGFSPCFRREIGSHGRDTKGLYRVHEFWKIEQFALCQEDYAVSEKLHQEMIAISEEMLQALELPYRVLQMTTGDMGAGKYKMFDIETWMPSRDAYGETHSASNLGTWQARRLNIRYQDGKQKRFVHTLNNTALASPRILIPLLELHQQEDGSVAIPEALRPFTGFDRITPKTHTTRP